MNFHSDDYINFEVKKHYIESLNWFDSEHIVGIFLQGSQNYGLDVEGSDIDTKLIITPTFEEIVKASNPVSTTHIRDNDEHIDFKDVRLYIKTFLRQNPNFLEILFTPYLKLNTLYADLWQELIDNRETIAHYDCYANIKALRGVAMEKYHSMEHRYPSKADIIDKYGYDPKQLHHLLRIEDFMERYIKGESYEECLIPSNPIFLSKIKAGLYGGDMLYTLEEAQQLANEAMYSIDTLYNDIDTKKIPPINTEIYDLLFDVQTRIIERSIINELQMRGAI